MIQKQNAPDEHTFLSEPFLWTRLPFSTRAASTTWTARRDTDNRVQVNYWIIAPEIRQQTSILSRPSLDIQKEPSPVIFWVTRLVNSMSTYRAIPDADLNNERTNLWRHPHGGVPGFPEFYVTKFAPHRSLKFIAWCNLTLMKGSYTTEWWVPFPTRVYRGQQSKWDF